MNHIIDILKVVHICNKSYYCLPLSKGDRYFAPFHSNQNADLSVFNDA